MKLFNLSDISKYSKELMGCSAILILICHSIAYIDMPYFFRYALSFGNIGVDLFFFLSGFGIFYSLRKNKTSIFNWYKIRFKKLLIPYLIIAIIFVIIKTRIGLLDNNIWFIIRYITTIEFWISHRGAWFIAALIPMYFISPVLYKLLCKYDNKIALALILLCYVIDFIPLKYFDNDIIIDVLSNIQFASIRINSFILGMWIGLKVEQNIYISIKEIIVMIVMGVLAVFVTKHLVYCYFFLCVPLLYIICIIIKHGSLIINRIFTFYGDITLESYLFNGDIPMLIIILFGNIGLNDTKNIFAYITSVILGTLLSYVFHLMNKKIVG